MVGYKEFHDYLTLPPCSEKAFDNAVKDMKVSTRRYAKRQVSWIRNKLLPAVYAANLDGQETGLVTPTYLLDATGDLNILVFGFSALTQTGQLTIELGENWDENVRNLGHQITEGIKAQLRFSSLIGQPMSRFSG